MFRVLVSCVEGDRPRVGARSRHIKWVSFISLSIFMSRRCNVETARNSPEAPRVDDGSCQPAVRRAGSHDSARGLLEQPARGVCRGSCIRAIRSTF